MYKPRSLAIDRWVADFIAQICAAGDLLDLKVPRVVTGADHGWAEYLAAEDILDAEALRRFFIRQGQWLAIFRVLNGNDFHFENMIGVGEHPVPIDLETIAQPALANSCASEACDRCIAVLTACVVVALP